MATDLRDKSKLSSDKSSSEAAGRQKSSGAAPPIHEGIIVSGIETPPPQDPHAAARIKNLRASSKRNSSESVNSSKKVTDKSEKKSSAKKVENINEGNPGNVSVIASEPVTTDAVKSESIARPSNEEIAGEDDIPDLSTKRQFGVNKGVISRAIVKFSAPPEPNPLTVCFHVQGVFLTHKQVLDVVRTTLATANLEKDKYTVTSIQFIDRNTIHGAQGMDNRWLITFDNPEAKRLLIHQGLSLYNRKVAVKEYDDILREEYKEFLEYKQLQNKLFAREDKDDLLEKQTEGKHSGLHCLAKEKDDEYLNENLNGNPDENNDGIPYNSAAVADDQSDTLFDDNNVVEAGEQNETEQ